MDLSLTIRICVQIAIRNTQIIKAKTYELLDQEYNPDMTLISNSVVDALNDLVTIEVRYLLNIALHESILSKKMYQ